jgi:hypothetical protein
MAVPSRTSGGTNTYDKYCRILPAEMAAFAFTPSCRPKKIQPA